MKLAQEIREGSRLSASGDPSIDQDLAHPALSVLGELIDSCGSEIEPAFLDGYAYGLCQAGLIDGVVLKAVRMHIGLGEEGDPAPSPELKH
jgi:hypothetical protein